MQARDDTNCSAGRDSHNLLILQKLEHPSLDLSDDEELREQMDMHSIIVSSISDEPLYTAEQVGPVSLRGPSSNPDCNNGGNICVHSVGQVIEEIEEMMQESPDPEDDESPSQSDLSLLSQDLHAMKRSGSSSSCEDRESLPGPAVHEGNSGTLLMAD